MRIAMYPHRIRLRGPWELTPIGELPRRLTFPATWTSAGLPGFRGRIALERRFGYPGRIDAHERVWLIGAGVVGPAEIYLQGELLGRVDGQFAFEVTERLRDRNVVEVALAVESGRTALWDDIALEVRATAYLQDVVRDGDVVRGRVAGTCDSLLEVYVLAAGATCGYREVTAGAAFEAAAAAGPLRVELVQVSTVWDVIELDAPAETSDNNQPPV